MKSFSNFRSSLKENVQASADVEYTLVNRDGKGVFLKHRARRIVHGGYSTDGPTKQIVPKDQQAINLKFQKKLEKIPDIQVKKIQNINRDPNNKKRRTEILYPQTPSTSNDGSQQPTVESVGHVQDPPPVLLLKRKTIRLFDEGIKVALYHNSVMNKYFTVAVGNNISGNYQVEEIDYDEENEILNESIPHSTNLMRMGKIQKIRRRIRRNAKGNIVVQRNARRSTVSGYRISGNTIRRIPAAERIRKSRLLKRSWQTTRKAQLRRSLMKKKMSMRRRASLGLR